MTKAITVRELIAQLLALGDEAQSLPVFSEGCDCWGEASGADIEMNGKVAVVLIQRSSEEVNP